MIKSNQHSVNNSVLASYHGERNSALPAQS